MTTIQTDKPTLLQLRRQAHLTSNELAREAILPLSQSYTVEIGGFCQEATAKRVLEAFNRLSHRTYTLEDICWQTAFPLRRPPNLFHNTQMRKGR